MIKTSSDWKTNRLGKFQDTKQSISSRPLSNAFSQAFYKDDFKKVKDYHKTLSENFTARDNFSEKHSENYGTTIEVLNNESSNFDKLMKNTHFDSTLYETYKKFDEGYQRVGPVHILREKCLATIKLGSMQYRVFKVELLHKVFPMKVRLFTEQQNTDNRICVGFNKIPFLLKNDKITDSKSLMIKIKPHI